VERCKATTRSGKQCLNNPLAGSDYCHIKSHQPPVKQKIYKRTLYFILEHKKKLFSVSTILGILGIILWWPFYVPNIHIDISSSSNDPLMPVPPSFSITNQGVFDTYSPEFICNYINIRAAKLSVTDYSSGARPLADGLYGSQTVDVSCPGIIGPLAKESDIEFLVSYQLAFTWKRSYACARFVIRENAHGRLQWFRTPPQECKPLWLRLQERANKRKAEAEALRKQFPK